jgi:hypothetical protein
MKTKGLSQLAVTLWRFALAVNSAPIDSSRKTTTEQAGVLPAFPFAANRDQCSISA